MAIINQVIKDATLLSNKTATGSITAQELGEILINMAKYIQSIERNGSILGIRKVYTSLQELQNDIHPIINEHPIRNGQLAIIFGDDDHNGKIYAWQGEWKEIGKIGEAKDILDIVKRIKETNQEILTEAGKLTTIAQQQIEKYATIVQNHEKQIKDLTPKVNVFERGWLSFHKDAALHPNPIFNGFVDDEISLLQAGVAKGDILFSRHLKRFVYKYEGQYYDTHQLDEAYNTRKDEVHVRSDRVFYNIENSLLYILKKDILVPITSLQQNVFSKKLIWGDLPWVEQGETAKYINAQGILVDDTRNETAQKLHPYHYTDFIELKGDKYTVSCCGVVVLYRDKQYTEASVVKVFGRYFYDSYYTNTFNLSDYPEAKYIAIGYNHTYNRKGEVRIIRHGADNEALEAVAMIQGIKIEDVEKPLSARGIANYGDLLENSTNKKENNVYAIAPKEPLKNNQTFYQNFALEMVKGEVIAFSNIYSLFSECVELKEVTVDIAKLKDSTWTAFYNCSNLQYLTLKNLGKEENMRGLNDNTFGFCVNLWKGEKGHKCMIDSLITYSFDRAAEGYEALKIELPAHVENLLTEGEQDIIAEKGFSLLFK